MSHQAAREDKRLMQQLAVDIDRSSSTFPAGQRLNIKFAALAVGAIVEALLEIGQAIRDHTRHVR